MHASIAAGLLLLAQLAGVAAHGYLITPKARSYGPSDAFYDDMSGNGAGLNVVFNSNPGICGDPFQGVPTTNFAGAIGPIQATYNVGATIPVTFQLTANHGGKIVMKLCPSSPASATQSCFNTYPLKRSDTGTTEYWITTGTYTGSAAVTLNYVLPAGVSCANGCLLQWEYVAMQSCIENCASAVCGPAYSTKYNPITGGTNMVACPVAKGPEVTEN
ncbi:hypothetical protein JKP88DRAFT_8904 [Tribonema minus]|uniref:Chitin-binding type-4 domain-containing protein n=1 Tax=Tribonema minus TaxID=303371 RepID=A0A835ZDH4_9STRA|nr:hypothetical protein JKP88DRAFT_8904 [Tribonema minus]